MTDFYEVLGVSPDATEDELRRAYRRRARELHPDLHPDPDLHSDLDEAMRRLNEAWRVLGSPGERRRYDAGLRVDEIGWEPAPEAARPLHRVRPSMWLVAVAILAAIFVITAYAAGPAPVTPVPRPQPDQCLARFPGYEAVVSCSQPNIGRVVQTLPGGGPGGGPSASCPAGTVRHPVLGRAEVVCLGPAG